MADVVFGSGTSCIPDVDVAITPNSTSTRPANCEALHPTKGQSLEPLAANLMFTSPRSGKGTQRSSRRSTEGVKVKRPRRVKGTTPQHSNPHAAEVVPTTATVVTTESRARQRSQSLEVRMTAHNSRELFHCHYSYNPLDEDGVGSSEERQNSPPQQQLQTPEARLMSSRSGDGVLCYQRTPGNAQAEWIQEETPFTPRWLPPSPFRSQQYSPQGSAHCTRRTNRQDTSLASGSATPHGRQALGHAVVDGKDDDAITAQLRSQLSATRERLAIVNRALNVVDAAVDTRKDQHAVLQLQLHQLQQQCDGLCGQITAARASTRTKMDQHRTREELAMLSDMVKERSARTETLRAMKVTLDKLFAQLKLLQQQSGGGCDSTDATEAEQEDDSEEDPVNAYQDMAEPARDALRSFLQNLCSEVEAMAMICIQLPSPSTASFCSRVHRAHTSLSINEGNNGFFSYFGGATEAHLSAKPLSTFLSCAGRLGRLGWRLEEELQLRARELAEDREEDELRARVAAAPQQKSSAVEMIWSSSPTTRASSEMERPAGRSTGGGTLSEALAANGSTASRSLLVDPAPVLLPASLAYAFPRLATVSRQEDVEQLRLQKDYTEEITRQRTARRQMAKDLLESYRQQVEPGLRACIEAGYGKQAALAAELVELGVVEVSLHWMEVEEAEVYTTASRSRRTGRPSSGGRMIALHKVLQQPEKAKFIGATARYVRQVTVHTWQAATADSIPHTLMTSVDRAGGDVGLVSSTRRLLHSVATGGETTPQSVPTRSITEGGSAPNLGRRSTTWSIVTTGGRPSVSEQPVVHAATSLHSVSPMSKTPLKGRHPPQARAHATPISSGPLSGRLNADGSGRGGACSSRLTDSSADGAAVHSMPTLVEDSREGLCQAGSAVDLLGVHPEESQEALDGGAVKVALVFHGEEGRRRAQSQAAREHYLQAFWQLRAELARVDEDVFLLRGRLAELKSTLAGKSEHFVATMADGEAKRQRLKDYADALAQERKEWESIRENMEQLVRGHAHVPGPRF